MRNSSVGASRKPRPRTQQARPLKPLHLLLSGIAISLLLIAGYGFFLFEQFNPGSLRQPLEIALSQVSRRDVRIDGNISLGFRKIIITRLTLSNTAGASRSAMMTVDSVTFTVKLLPLLHNEIALDAVRLDGADIRLERDGAGHGNWELPIFSQMPASDASQRSSIAQDVPLPNAGSGPHTLRLSGLRSIILANSQIEWNASGPGVNALSMADISKAAMQFPTVKTTQIKVIGNFQGKDFLLNIQTGYLGDLFAKGQSRPFAIQLEAGGYRLSLNANLTHADDGIKLDDLLLTSGASQLAGQLSLMPEDGRLDISGSLSGNSLDMADLIGNGIIPDEDGKDPPDQSPIFSDARIPFDFLGMIDANIALSLTLLRAHELTLNNFSAQLKIAKGVLSLDMRSSAPFLRHPMLASLQAAAPASQQPAVFLEAIANSIDLAKLWQSIGRAPLLETIGDARLEIGGRGQSLHELAGTAVGSARLITGNGGIDTGALSLLAVDLPNLFNVEGSQPRLTCLVADALIRNGNAEIGIFMDSSHMALAGTGQIDLGHEQIDMAFRPMAKMSSLASLLGPFQLTGDLVAPTLRFDKSVIARKAVGLALSAIDPEGLAAETLMKSFSGESTMRRDAQSCAAALESPQAEADAVENDGSAPESLNPVANIIQEGSTMLKNLLGGSRGY